MKRTLYIIIAAITIGSGLYSCEPVEDRESLDAVTLTPATTKFSITQNPANDHEVIVKNEDPSVIPYWHYIDSKGNELGHSNKGDDKIILPFGGSYKIYYTAYTRGGAVQADPVSVTVAKNDDAYFSDPRWSNLTNGIAGKTWVLDMIKPLEFVDSNYINSTLSPAGWWPVLTDISWAGLENKNWGEITFDLNGGYNVSVTQTNPKLGSTVQTTKKATFNFTLTTESRNDRIVFNGGTEMLHPNEASYFSSASSFANVKIVELTPTTLSFLAIRADGGYLVYHLIVKP
ncbi:hypothetical protein ACHRV6_14420 [Flavobacterium sp. FlaQc-51]|uniref:hypothetical protein n=1 Tax=unclassified Flavobacterium TaxID=196869 RepID=UPI000AD62A92|nr:hypothetical protein [Flavobacterium sp. Leaf82]